jgi:ATP-dependent phosphoenolpyruvate carboxykinase
MLEALLRGNIKWKKDPDFGYEIVDVDAPENAALLEQVPAEILEPRRFFESRGRDADYRQWVEHMKHSRREFLRKFQVSDAIIQSTVG